MILRGAQRCASGVWSVRIKVAASTPRRWRASGHPAAHTGSIPALVRVRRPNAPEARRPSSLGRMLAAEEQPRRSRRRPIPRKLAIGGRANTTDPPPCPPPRQEPRYPCLAPGVLPNLRPMPLTTARPAANARAIRRRQQGRFPHSGGQTPQCIHHRRRRATPLPRSRTRKPSATRWRRRLRKCSSMRSMRSIVSRRRSPAVRPSAFWPGYARPSISTNCGCSTYPETLVSPDHCLPVP